MYLRHTTRWKDGKAHTCWRLVRSVRRNGKVVQETVAQLGELDARGRAKARALALQITGRGDQRDLFEQQTGSAQTVQVRLDQLRLERSRAFGAVWLGWILWRALDLDRVCEDVVAGGRPRVPWPLMASILVIARLCEPSSELHIAEDWYRRTALEDLLGVPAEVVNDDRLYRALDQLLPHKTALEQHLVTRLGTLFALDYDLLLYDVTSTYFEGEAAANALAKRGYSRDHRPDCVQVNIALVVTRQGMPLGYELFAGNTTSRDVHDINYWMVDDDYDGSSFIVRQVFFCGGDKDEFDDWKKGLSNLAVAATRKKAEQTLKIEIDAEAFANAYGHTSRPFPVKSGQKVAVRVVSQFGEETTKVLPVD